MKVVILAGGLPSTLIEEDEKMPKPMAEIGGRPMLWHIMKQYAYYGYNDFNRVVKRGWEHFDNAVINKLRLLDKLNVKKVKLVGFDGFKHQYNESYADRALPTLNPDNHWDELNIEIKAMFCDFMESKKDSMQIDFLTESIFQNYKENI